MAVLPHDIAKIFATLLQVLREEGKRGLVELLGTSEIDLEETSYDNWNGGTYGYTLHVEVPVAAYVRLGNLLDEVEKDLCERLGRLTRRYQNESIDVVIIAPGLEESATSAPQGALGEEQGSFWKEGEFRLFLSHLSEHKEVTSRLAASLSSYGISAFVAHEDIEPTKEWEEEIRRALATCDALACLLTEGFNSSKWTDQEVGFVMGRGALVIPVRLGLDPYGFMGRFQGYQGAGKDPLELARGIVEILARHPLTATKMADGLIQAFEQSGSFTMAKGRANALRLVRSWTPEQAGRVRRATEENDQIARAFGVQEAVDDILASQTAPRLV